MPFLEIAEMKSAVYAYQLSQISEGDDTIILIGIETAIEEVRSYLTANNQHRFRDGRLLYDTEQIFNDTGSNRNPLLLAVCKTIAEWWITQLCNADIIYQQLKERYDRATAWLKQLADGTVNLSSLPQLDPETENNPAAATFTYGSRPKFNHE